MPPKANCNALGSGGFFAGVAMADRGEGKKRAGGASVSDDGHKLEAGNVGQDVAETRDAEMSKTAPEDRR